MTEELFDIAAEDGSLFYKCSYSGDSPVLYGKYGRLSLDLLLRQTHNRDFAMQMRNKKARGQKPRQ